MDNLDTMLKEEMIKTIEELNPNNIEFQRNRINRLLHLYIETNELFPKENITSSKLVFPKFNSIQAIEHSNETLATKNNEQFKEYVDKDNKNLLGRLERGLLGGTIKVKDVSIFVPERKIRELSLKHGDWIKATYHNLDKVIFEKVAESTTEHLTKRKAVQYAIVSDKYLNGDLVANQAYVNGVKTYIRLDEEAPFTFIITDYEKQKFKLLPGDLVEIAYYKDYKQTYKVAWKYNSYEISHLDNKKVSFPKF